MWIHAMKASLKFTFSHRTSGPCRSPRQNVGFNILMRQCLSVSRRYRLYLCNRHEQIKKKHQTCPASLQTVSFYPSRAWSSPLCQPSSPLRCTESPSPWTWGSRVQGRNQDRFVRCGSHVWFELVLFAEQKRAHLFSLALCLKSSTAFMKRVTLNRPLSLSSYSRLQEYVVSAIFTLRLKMLFIQWSRVARASLTLTSEEPPSQPVFHTFSASQCTTPWGEGGVV